MKHTRLEDLPSIEEAFLDAPDADEEVCTLTTDIIFALKQGWLPPEIKGLLSDQLRLFSTSHDSIRELIKVAINASRPAMVADALSLVREQVEKLYVIALFLNSPKKWFRPKYRTKV